MDSVPQTSAYLIAGYLTFAAVLSAYLLSLFLRWRALQKRRRALLPRNDTPSPSDDSEV